MRNVRDLRNAIHELDVIIEENANQLKVVKEAEAIQLEYKVYIFFNYLSVKRRGNTTLLK
jgi:hypothetical protein